MDWDNVDPSPLFDEIRERFLGPDAEKMVWAFERALEAARVDPHLLDCVLVASACLVAHAEQVTPRTVFEQYFRRAVPDEDWRDRYGPLLAWRVE
jgi:hypothetical protein